jgi:hypothetical protein
MHCPLVYDSVLTCSLCQEKASEQGPLFVLLLMLTVAILRDETAVRQTQLLHSLLVMTVTGHCPVPETIQTKLKSLSVCLSVLLYVYDTVLWLVAINEYTEVI